VNKKMKANKKVIEADDHAVSAVIGVILMVAVAIAMAAVAYAYLTGMIGGQSDYTPIISLTPEKSDHNATLSLIDISDPNVNWNDVWFTFVDKTNQTQWQNVPTGAGWSIQVGIPRTGTMSAGQIIAIRTTRSGTLSVDTPLAINHNYQFTLMYNSSGGTMGIVEWTQ
jgi:FlaG/FlaF family flagellin (archaellin)